MEKMFWPGKGFCFDEARGVVWFITYHKSFLCSFSLIQNKITLVRSITKEYSKSDFAFSDVVLVDRYLVLVPANVRDIVVYNIDDDCFERITLDSDESLKYNRYNFGIVRADTVYMFPLNQNHIVKYNVKSKRIDKISVSDSPLDDFSLFNFDYCQVNDSVYFLSSKESLIIRFLLSKEEFEYYRFSDNIGIFNTILHLNNNRFFLSTQNGDFFEVDFDSGVNRLIQNRIAGFGIFEDIPDKRGPVFASSIKENDEITVFPYLANMIVKYDLKNDLIYRVTLNGTIYGDGLQDGFKGMELAGFTRMVKYGNKYVGFFLANRSMIVFNRLIDDFDIILTNNVEIDEEITTVKNILKIKNGMVFESNDGVDLDSYIRTLPHF